ncbi:MAG: YdcF family protein [Clostridia bacterium]|nr:YdcF family protein [Clostridia bacterium]
MKLMRTVLIVLGGVMLLDTAVLCCLSNLNAGIVLPAILGLPLLLIGLFFEPLRAFFRTRLGAVVKWALILGYGAYALLLVVIGSLIYSEAHQTPPQDADAIVVLGCGIRGERVSLTLKYRLDAALEYIGENPDVLVVLSGGQGPQEDISEAEAMYRYMSARGVDQSRLRKEDKSTSTSENFRYSMEIIESELGDNANVVFVTTGFHVLRAELVAAKLSIRADGIGASDVSYLSPNNYMRETLVIVYYKLRGMI